MSATQTIDFIAAIPTFNALSKIPPARLTPEQQQILDIRIAQEKLRILRDHRVDNNRGEESFHAARYLLTRACWHLDNRVADIVFGGVQ